MKYYWQKGEHFSRLHLVVSVILRVTSFPLMWNSENQDVSCYIKEKKTKMRWRFIHPNIQRKTREAFLKRLYCHENWMLMDTGICILIEWRKLMNETIKMKGYWLFYHSRSECKYPFQAWSCCFLRWSLSRQIWRACIYKDIIYHGTCRWAIFGSLIQDKTSNNAYPSKTYCRPELGSFRME